MILTHRNILNGLTGWWSDFWGGVKGALTVWDSSDDHPTTFAGKLGKWLTRLAIVAALKTVYNPNPNEVAILNPIKTALNNWVTNAINTCDAILENGSTVQFSNYANQTIRQLQLIRDYYLAYQIPGLSQDAQIFLSEQIDLMIEMFETTIEELLIGNGISYTKIDIDLAKIATDEIPAIIQIPNGFTTSGFLYQIDVDNTTVIATDIPPIENIVVATPTQSTGGIVPVSTVPSATLPIVTTTTPQTSTPPKNNYKGIKVIGFLGLCYGLYELVFKGDEQKKESKI